MPILHYFYHVYSVALNSYSFDNFDAKLDKIYFVELTYWANFAKKQIAMIHLNKKICPHDHICPLIKACPVGAISQDSEGFPVINHNLCIECGKCVRKCPMKAMEQIARE